MPLRRIKLGIWRISSPVGQGEGIPAAEVVPEAYLNLDKIIAELNRIYVQASIQFFADPPLKERHFPLGANHALDISFGYKQYDVVPDPGDEGKEYATVLQGALKEGPFEQQRMNVLIFHRFSRTTPAFSVRDVAPDRCLIQTYPFEKLGENPGVTEEIKFKRYVETIAHEIGHLLMLSIHRHRNADATDNHDGGTFPSRYYTSDGVILDPNKWDKPPADSEKGLRAIDALMSASDLNRPDRWIRNEDWKWANDGARRYEDKVYP